MPHMPKGRREAEAARFQGLKDNRTSCHLGHCMTRKSPLRHRLRGWKLQHGFLSEQHGKPHDDPVHEPSLRLRRSTINIPFPRDCQHSFA